MLKLSGLDGDVWKEESSVLSVGNSVLKLMTSSLSPSLAATGRKLPAGAPYSTISSPIEAFNDLLLDNPSPTDLAAPGPSTPPSGALQTTVLEEKVAQQQLEIWRLRKQVQRLQEELRLRDLQDSTEDVVVGEDQQEDIEVDEGQDEVDIQAEKNQTEKEVGTHLIIAMEKAGENIVNLRRM